MTSLLSTSPGRDECLAKPLQPRRSYLMFSRPFDERAPTDPEGINIHVPVDVRTLAAEECWSRTIPGGYYPRIKRRATEKRQCSVLTVRPNSDGRYDVMGRLFRRPLYVQRRMIAGRSYGQATCAFIPLHP